jgi:hypothetical protein
MKAVSTFFLIVTLSLSLSAGAYADSSEIRDIEKKIRKESTSIIARLEGKVYVMDFTDAQNPKYTSDFGQLVFSLLSNFLVNQESRKYDIVEGRELVKVMSQESMLFGNAETSEKMLEQVSKAGMGTLVTGDYKSDGSSIVIHIKATNAKTGDVIASTLIPIDSNQKLEDMLRRKFSITATYNDKEAKESRAIGAVSEPVVKSAILDDPTVPLNVGVWTDKKEYRKGEKIKIYLKGNKPFYCRVVYNDASGKLIQLLPNPYRKENYFNGGAIYEIPSGKDDFELEVEPPFGTESVVVYASTAEIGEIDLKASGGVYEVKTSIEEIGIHTRGVGIKKKASNSNDKKSQEAEHAVASIMLKTF